MCPASCACLLVLCQQVLQRCFLIQYRSACQVTVLIYERVKPCFSAPFSSSDPQSPANSAAPVASLHLRTGLRPVSQRVAPHPAGSCCCRLSGQRVSAVRIICIRFPAAVVAGHPEAVAGTVHIFQYRGGQPGGGGSLCGIPDFVSCRCIGYACHHQSTAAITEYRRHRQQNLLPCCPV